MSLPRGFVVRTLTPGRRCPTCGADPCGCAPRRALLASPIDTRPLHEVTGSWARRHHPVAEDCVCGGPDIRAASGSDEDIVAAVRQHHVEPVHIAWDVAHGIPLSEQQLRAKAVDGDLTEGR